MLLTLVLLINWAIGGFFAELKYIMYATNWTFGDTKVSTKYEPLILYLIFLCPIEALQNAVTLHYIMGSVKYEIFCQFTYLDVGL